MNAVTIYHNPACGTSRNVLAMLKEAGVAPQVVEYLKTPLTQEQLRALVDRLGIPARALLRAKEARHAELDLGNPKWSDDDLLGFMAQNPILMNRPVVVTPQGAKLCRPAEEVWSVVPKP